MFFTIASTSTAWLIALRTSGLSVGATLALKKQNTRRNPRAVRMSADRFTRSISSGGSAVMRSASPVSSSATRVALSGWARKVMARICGLGPQ